MKEIDLVRVTVPNHPKTRALTPEGYYDFSRGNTGELAHNNWIHCRIFMLGTEQQYAGVYDAFKHTDPFARLGWTVKDSCPTSSIYRWTYAVQPMYDYHHKSSFTVLTLSVSNNLHESLFSTYQTCVIIYLHD